MRRYALPLVLLVAVVAGVMAGCGRSPATPAALPTDPPTQAAVDIQTETPPNAATAPAGAATPTARSGQEATDPTTVTLAAGRPTLVKFFAFW